MKSKTYKWRVEKTTDNEYAIYFITEIWYENGMKAVGSQMCQPLQTLEVAEHTARQMYDEIKNRLKNRARIYDVEFKNDRCMMTSILGFNTKGEKRESIRSTK